MRPPSAFRAGDWVEVRPEEQISGTLDREGTLDGLPFMPEMLRHLGGRYRIQAVMTTICGGGPGMRAVRGEPLVLLDQLRCVGDLHGGCSRACTLLWKPAWLRPAPAAAERREGAPGEARPGWTSRTQDDGGAWACQATALRHATLPMSKPRKVKKALEDVRDGEWTAGRLVVVYAQTIAHRVRLLLRRLRGAIAGKSPTPVESLDLQVGDRVQVKPMHEIAATLDRNSKNRGLEFSRYMIPFCGGTYRVAARMSNFIDEGTGEMRQLQNTVLLEGVSCGGETTSGPCRRAEYLYWREIWLRRVRT